MFYELKINMAISLTKQCLCSYVSVKCIGTLLFFKYSPTIIANGRNDKLRFVIVVYVVYYVAI